MLVYAKAHFAILLLAGIRSCEGDGVPTHLRSRHLDVATNNLEKNNKATENADAHNAKDDGMAANEKMMSFVGLFKGVSENLFFVPFYSHAPPNFFALPKQLQKKSANTTAQRNLQDCADTQNEDSTDWVQPEVSFWRGTPFSGKTCEELKTISPTASEDLCEFFSMEITYGLTAKDACCFCGGGSTGSSSGGSGGGGSGSSSGSGSCANMDFNTMQEGDNAFDCAFIDDNIPGKESFCATFGTATFAQDGLTISEACCACGGGDKSGAATALRQRRNLQLVLAGDGSPNQAIAIDYKYNLGLGDSPGIPNLEYRKWFG